MTRNRFLSRWAVAGIKSYFNVYIAVPEIMANSDNKRSTELSMCCLFTAAESISDAARFI